MPFIWQNPLHTFLVLHAASISLFLGKRRNEKKLDSYFICFVDAAFIVLCTLLCFCITFFCSFHPICLQFSINVRYCNMSRIYVSNVCIFACKAKREMRFTCAANHGWYVFFFSEIIPTFKSNNRAP